jgi:hypothetical protein
MTYTRRIEFGDGDWIEMTAPTGQQRGDLAPPTAPFGSREYAEQSVSHLVELVTTLTTAANLHSKSDPSKVYGAPLTAGVLRDLGSTKRWRVFGLAMLVMEGPPS